MATRTPVGQRLGPEHQRHVEQLVERVDPDDPGLAEQGVDGDVGAGHRGRVRRGGPDAGGRAAALHRDDRLAARDPPGDAAELAGVAERLEVQQHDVGAGVVLPVLQQVVAADVGLVADRHEARHAEPDAGRPLEHGDAERARLRLHRDATRLGRVRREGGVEADGGVDDADAVGPDEPHAVDGAPGRAAAACVAAPPATSPNPAVSTTRPATPLRRTLVDDVQDRGCGNGDHRQVDGVGDVEHASGRP